MTYDDGEDAKYSISRDVSMPSCLVFLLDDRQTDISENTVVTFFPPNFVKKVFDVGGSPLSVCPHYCPSTMSPRSSLPGHHRS